MKIIYKISLTQSTGNIIRYVTSIYIFIIQINFQKQRKVFPCVFMTNSVEKKLRADQFYNTE